MAIRIISKVDGFRRGGMEHPAAPAEYADDAFTAEELAVLRAEPMLLVDVIYDQPPADADLPTLGSGLKVTIEDLDDLNPHELVEVAKAGYGVTLDPDTDWDVLRADVEVLMRAKAAAEEA